MEKALKSVKFIVIVAFMITLCSTYYLRSEVLKLNTIRFSSDNIRAEEELRQLKESHPLRQQEYEVAVENYDLQMEHYEEMLDIYRTDYDEYVRRLDDDYHPPRLPSKPNPPRTPEMSDRLAEINIEFREQQYHYYKTTSVLNWLCCLSSLALTGGLLFLIMFDVNNQRLFYVAVLILSFVFMIGPSFHSIMSAIVGFLHAPSIR